VKSVVKLSAFPFSFRIFRIFRSQNYPCSSDHRPPQRTGPGRLADGYRTGSTLTIARQNAAADGWTGPGGQVYPTPCRVDGRAQHFSTRPARSTPTINHPELSGVIRSVLQNSLRITPGRLTPIRSEPDSTGAIRSYPEFHRQIQILCRARLSSPTLYSRLLSPSVANSCE
jgi:hypothetical protein